MAEFLGTALLIFFGTGCVAALKVAGASFGLWEISIIWGVGVSMAIYLSAGISGAHLNPAVSIALCIFADFDKRKSQDFWTGLHALVPQWDEMITAFNRDSGMSAAA